METVLDFLSFAALWLGAMALIGGALYLTQRFRKKDEEKSINAEDYAKNFEEALKETTPEKPIKEKFRNPFFLSQDEIKETKERTEGQ
ncbi:MAG: hypothetical protein IIW94_01065 [Clostridia bacterium]|nr:hypothetical protein [Clostridia bacterium]